MNHLRNQQEQWQHDQKCSTEILHLPIQQKLQHYLNHLVKYAAQLHSPSPDYLRILRDTYIINLCIHNTYRTALTETTSEQSEPYPLAQHYSIILGMMAKALEARDHGEDHMTQTMILTSNQLLTNVITAYAEKHGLNITRAIHEAWRNREHKNPLL